MKNRERFIRIMLLVMIIGQFSVFATEIMKPVEELSTPKYRGRLSGTEGNKQAEEYIAEQFREIGLAFLEGYEDYFQEFVQPVRLMNHPPKMSIIEDTGEVIAFRYLEDFVVSVGPGMMIDEETEAKGVVLKEFSQLKTILETVAGKILLIPADVFKKNQGYIMKSIINTNEKPAGIILEAELNRPFFPRSLTVSLSASHDPKLLPLLFSIRKNQFEKLLVACEKEQIIQMTANYEVKQVQSNNVIGVVNGTYENQEKKKVFIIGAHMDGAGDNKNGTYNPSAQDNASGIAVLLACARELQRMNQKLNSTYIFIAFNGEEQGRYGSLHFVSEGFLSTEGMEMINIDNVGSEKDIPLLIETIPGQANKLQKTLLQNAEKNGIRAKANESRGSDHLSFAEKGIAAVNLIHPDNAFAHSPTDTPEKISEQKIKEITELIVSTVIE